MWARGTVSLEIKFTEGVSAGLAADYALITGMPGRAVTFGHKAYNIKCLHYSSVTQYISVYLGDSSGIRAASNILQGSICRV